MEMIPFDAKGAFRFVVHPSNFRRLAVRGAGATVSASGLNLVFQVIGMVILARLLTPADFGVVAMVTTFSLLLVSVGMNGLTEAIIQCEEIDRYTASNLCWLNSGVGLVLAAAFAAFGSVLARFYQNALVANAAAGMSLAIAVTGVSVVHISLLKRDMRFAAISANEVVARVTYFVVTLVFAWMGWGYWALVAGYVAHALSTTVGALWLCRWIPSLPRRTGRTGTFVRFAATVYGRFSVRYAIQNIDNILVGWQFNAGTLGFYKKAYDLFALSASQVTVPLHHVALAALSRLIRDPTRFKRTFIKSVGMISFVGMALGSDLTLVGKHVVRLVLGQQWAEAGAIFMFFGPGIGIMLVYSTIGWIHLSIGRPDRWLHWSILEFIVTAILFIVALHWGPGGIAVAWSVSYWALLIPGFWYAGRPIGFGVSSLIAAIWRYAAASLAASLATVAIIRGTPLWATPSSTTAALAAIIIISALFATLYLSMVILLHRGPAPLYQFATLLRELAVTRGTTRSAGEPVVENTNDRHRGRLLNAPSP